MNAGLPGLGLGGLFFILTALVAPLIELGRTIRGESSPVAWATVGRQFGLAVAMIVAIELTLRGALLLVAGAGVDGAGSGRGVTALPAAPLAVTVALLIGLLAATKGLQLLLRARERGRPARVIAVLTARRRYPVRTVATAVSISLSLLIAAVAVAAAAAAPAPEAPGPGQYARYNAR